MWSKVKSFICEHRLLQQGRRYVVALSGGADSVALLRCLLALDYQIEAAHCNFHLRGEESDRDEQFVAELCQQLNIPLHRAHFDTKCYAEIHKVSIEMAARDLRYRYFEQLRQDLEAEAICVAHHEDDSVETVLINLIRGTGIHGLTGIRPRQGHIVRPLLCLSRKEIEMKLAQLNQPYVTDSTNLTADVVRNKIRLQVLPLLRDINPSAATNILVTSKHMAAAERLYDATVASQLSALTTTSASGVASMSIDQLLALPAPECVLFEWLQGFHFSSSSIQQIFNNLSSQTGTTWSSSTHDLILNRGQILVEPHHEPIAPFRIPEEGNYTIENIKITIESIHQSAGQYSHDIDRSPLTATLDAAKVGFPLTIRPVQEGDRFTPFGMKGSKLVSDFLTDQKASLFERRRQLVITDRTGAIIWLVGRRPDQRFCITEATTSLLVCKIIES